MSQVPNVLSHSVKGRRHVFGGTRVGIVLSGGGSRAAYQVGALRALSPYLTRNNMQVSVVVGSSMGAINGIMFAGELKNGFLPAVDLIDTLWRARTYRNTFEGSISRSFVRAIQIAVLRYRSPGPSASSISIFNPAPIRTVLESALENSGGIQAIGHASALEAVAVMTTVEGDRRKPLVLASLFKEVEEQALTGATFELLSLPKLTVFHGLASAALPSVLPAVDLDIEAGQVRLVDGGICDNIPIDPAVRLGATEVISIDSSGRRWWFDHYGQPHYTRPVWEVPAGEATFCLMPTSSIECLNIKAFGPVLKEAVGTTTREFVTALGPMWPIFKILKHRMGEDLALEVMSYVALHPPYIAALIDLGFEETAAKLKHYGHSETASDGTAYCPPA